MELTTGQALQQGVAAHKEGKLQEAERLYRSILQSQPQHPDANHNLGVLAVSVNKANAALPLFKTALEANPKIEQFWLSYIDALIREKQFDNAKQVLEQARKQGVDGGRLDSFAAQLSPSTEKPNTAGVSPPQELLNSLLGHYQNGRFNDAEKLAERMTQEFPRHQFAWKVLGVVLGQTGRKSEAVAANQTAVELSPQDADAHSNLGITLQELGRLDEAESSYTQAISLKPDFAEAHFNLGNTLQELGRLEEAEASYNQAIALKSDFADAHSNLGNTLKELGRLDEAVASYTQALSFRPDYAEAHSNLGNTLQELGRLEEAVASLRQAVSLKPDYAAAHNNIGITAYNQGKLDEAMVLYNKALAIEPDYADAFYNLGVVLRDQGKLDEAIESFNQAISIRPDYADAHNNIGIAAYNQGKLDEAIEAFNQTISIKPDYAEAYSNMGNALKGFIFTKPNRGLQDVIISVLDKQTYVRPSDIARAGVSLLKLEPNLQEQLQLTNSDELMQSPLDVISELNKFPLLLKLMKVCPLPAVEIEELLKNLRANILANISSLTEAPNELLRFQSALALQCFTNEYIYNQTKEESKNLLALEKIVENKFEDNEQPTPQEVLVLASYKALNQYDWYHLLIATDEINEAFIRQIKEQKTENDLKSGISVLEAVTDNVSLKVREQYEEKPVSKMGQYAITPSASAYL
jgi:tetratricopeptide (TPR) repeat protein